MKTALLLAAWATGLGLPSLAAQASPAALTRQVFVAESSFAATMARRDLDGFARFLSPEAVFFGDTSVFRGKAEVVQAWRKFYEGAKPPFSWKPGVIEVLPSGTLALSSGPVFDPTGKRVASFTSIWRRDPGGNWLIIFDKGCS